MYQSTKNADDTQTRRNAHRSHVLQAWAFGILLVIFVVGSWATMRQLPMPPQHQPLDTKQVVNVIGHQWYWDIKPDTVKAGSKVAFRVTSADVNHDFAIYAPNGRVVANVQAMPGYTNKMVYAFTKPGTYTVQCLEYCGLGHAPMHSTLHVIKASARVATTGMNTGKKTDNSNTGISNNTNTATTQQSAASKTPDGAQIFSANCAVCHQKSGTGIPKVFPPLNGNSAVNDPDPTKQIQVVLHGLHDETIDGKTYQGTMTPFASVLTDREIAAVINHERSSWGNHGKPVTAEKVAAVRKAGKSQ